MEDNIKNLERRYEILKGKDGIFDFFSGLTDYLNFATGEPVFNTIIEKELKKKEVLNEELAELEETSWKELQVSKEKLLKIIRDNKIDPTLVKGLYSWSDDNPIKELEAFESGKINISGFRTDNLENYLYDIATGIGKLGFQNELKELIIPQSKNQGRFEFSKTLDVSRKKREEISKAKAIEVWGAYDNLLKFHFASKEVVSNTPWGDIAPKYAGHARTHLEVKDAVDVAMFAGEWSQVVSATAGSFPKPQYPNHLYKLNLATFKSSLDRAHMHLIAEAPKSKADKPKVDNKELIQSIFGGKATPEIKEMIREIIKEQLQVRDEIPEPSKRFWKDGELPIYDPIEGVIHWGTKITKIPLGSNMAVVCKTVFDAPLGEWITEESVINDFYKDGKRSFYDAVNGVNEKVEESFGIQKFLEYKASRTRIRSDIQEL